MRLLLFLLTSATTWALPSFEKAREALGSPNALRREALTQEIWKAGREAIPLLTRLAQIDDPEIAIRATFVLERLRMGLQPDSPPELLSLATETQIATPSFRIQKLENLLEHAEGANVALVLLDTWASDPLTPNDHLFKLAKSITESLLESRVTWKNFLSAKLTPRCRGSIIAALSEEGLPMNSQMIAKLAMPDIQRVWEMVSTSPTPLSIEGSLSLAKVSTIQGNLPLALDILGDGLAKADSPELARAIAFLEVGGQVPPIDYQGNWLAELQLFRARAARDFRTTLQRSEDRSINPILRYESHLISGSLTFPSTEEHITFPQEKALSPLHQFFNSPPGQPDIEALSSSLFLDWSELCRTLLLLTQPTEAAERLAAEEQTTTALGVYWKTGQHQKASQLADELLADENQRNHVLIRLTMTSLHLTAEDRDGAKAYFEPLFARGIENERHLISALQMGRKLFTREELLPLAPRLSADRAFKRGAAVTGFLPFPPKVSTYWYEYFRAQDESQQPSAILERVENFLTKERDQATQLIEEELRKSTKARLLPTDSLYQQALFLRVTDTLQILEKAAWYQLSSSDLLKVIQDDSWPLQDRKDMLRIALQIDPLNPVLRWFDQKLNQTSYPLPLHLHTLANPALAMQLGRMTGKRETLALTCELANVKDASSLRCLGILAQSYLENQQAEEAARLLQTLFCGEIAAGPQPASGIQSTLDRLAAYFKARQEIAKTPDEVEVWAERLHKIGR